MIKLFVKTDCLGSEKAEKFLEKNEIRYERINLSYAPIEEEYLFLMRDVATPNILDIVNFNSSFFENHETLKEQLLQMRERDILTFIRENHDCLSFPIALDLDDKMRVRNLFIGFNDSEWKILVEEEGSWGNNYSNINKSYIFKTCCFYDEVKNDDTNILVNLEKNA